MNAEQRATAPCCPPTGPGWYRLRSGMRHYVCGQHPSGLWLGVNDDQQIRSHEPNGQYLKSGQGPGDIIGPWREPRTEARRVWVIVMRFGQYSTTLQAVDSTRDYVRTLYPDAEQIIDQGTFTVTDGEGV